MSDQENYGLFMISKNNHKVRAISVAGKTSKAINEIQGQSLLLG